MFDKKLLDETIETSLKARESLHCELQEMNAYSKEEDDAFCAKTDKIKELRKYIAEKDFVLKDLYLLLAADFENYKRRNNSIVDTTKAATKQELLVKFLDIYDSMERMLAHIQRYENNEIISRELSGFSMIVENLKKVFEAEGFTKIECACGDTYDVNYHEAIAARNIEAFEKYSPNSVVDIYQTGWMFNGKLVRPVKVIVGK